MTMTDTGAVRGTTADQLLAAARGLRDELVERQAEAEARTYYAEDLHERFEALGFYRMLIPKGHGGLEVTPRTFFDVVIELARGDMSTAWCFALSANHPLMVANWFPEEVHAEIFAGGDFRAALMYAPSVTAVPDADGGWELNGTVNFCSGIPYSTFFIGQARLPGATADGSPRFGIYIVPKSEYTRLDDWGHLHGLRASGSHSIRLDHAHIKHDYLVEDADIVAHGMTGHSPGSRAYGNPMYSGRQTSTFAISLAALTIGGAYNLLDAYESVMRTRSTTLPPFVPRVEDPDYQRWYGEAFTKIGLAQAALDNVLDQWLDLARTNVAGTHPFGPADDMRLAAIARELMLQMWEVADVQLYRTIGAGASRTGDRFERVFRDMAQAAGHRNPQLRDPSFRFVAQQQLGLVAE